MRGNAVDDLLVRLDGPNEPAGRALPDEDPSRFPGRAHDRRLWSGGPKSIASIIRRAHYYKRCTSTARRLVDLLVRQKVLLRDTFLDEVKQSMHMSQTQKNETIASGAKHRKLGKSVCTHERFTSVPGNKPQA